jgi:hypothetical protein
MPGAKSLGVRTIIIVWIGTLIAALALGMAMFGAPEGLVPAYVYGIIILLTAWLAICVYICVRLIAFGGAKLIKLWRRFYARQYH